MKRISLLIACCLLVIFAGCRRADNTPSEIAKLKLDNEKLNKQLAQSAADNTKVKKQLETLVGLKIDPNLDNLPTVQEVIITRYTNLYDKNNDGKKETLVVYLQPVDQDGDIIKTDAAVDVELWDLNKSGPNMLGSWHVTPRELRKLWFTSLVSTNYKLSFDVTGKVINPDEPLTLKVKFTDYVTGKTFNLQQVIKD